MVVVEVEPAFHQLKRVYIRIEKVKELRHQFFTCSFMHFALSLIFLFCERVTAEITLVADGKIRLGCFKTQLHGKTE